MYIAIRLAKYCDFARDLESLPMDLGDIVDTFYDMRTKVALQLCAKIRASWQAIQFTLHAHLVEMARASVPGVAVLDMPLDQLGVQLSAECCSWQNQVRLYATIAQCWSLRLALCRRGMFLGDALRRHPHRRVHAERRSDGRRPRVDGPRAPTARVGRRDRASQRCRKRSVEAKGNLGLEAEQGESATWAS